jgi:hypothetical protein
MSEIATQLLARPSTITRIPDQLVADGLIACTRRHKTAASSGFSSANAGAGAQGTRIELGLLPTDLAKADQRTWNATSRELRILIVDTNVRYA